MMTKRLVTKEELNWLFTSSGCDWTTDNGQGAHCAMGKLEKLGIWVGNTETPDIVIVNNFGDENTVIVGDEWAYGDQSSYDVNSPLWPKHERAIKLGLQYLLKTGRIKLEDEAAKEFSELLKKEPVGAV